MTVTHVQRWGCEGGAGCSSNLITRFLSCSDKSMKVSVQITSKQCKEIASRMLRLLYIVTGNAYSFVNITLELATHKHKFQPWDFKSTKLFQPFLLRSLFDEESSRMVTVAVELFQVWQNQRVSLVCLFQIQLLFRASTHCTLEPLNPSTKTTTQ